MIGGKTIVDISAGDRHALVLAADGLVYGYSRTNWNAQVGDFVVTSDRDYFVPSSMVAPALYCGERVDNIYATFDSSIVTTNFGRVLAWGNSNVRLI